MNITLQHTATHSNTLEHTATHCNTMQHAVAQCSTLQQRIFNATEERDRRCELIHEHDTATHCNTLQHAATRCNREFVARLMKLTGVASLNDLGCSRAYVACHGEWGNYSWGEVF